MGMASAICDGRMMYTPSENSNTWVCLNFRSVSFFFVFCFFNVKMYMSYISPKMQTNPQHVMWIVHLARLIYAQFDLKFFAAWQIFFCMNIEIHSVVWHVNVKQIWHWKFYTAYILMNDNIWIWQLQWVCALNVCDVGRHLCIPQ